MLIRIASMNVFERSAQIRVLIAIEANISRPPIVGVPCFDECDSGPSSLITSPIFSPSSRLINLGPKTKETTRAVKALSIPLVVI